MCCWFLWVILFCVDLLWCRLLASVLFAWFGSFGLVDVPVAWFATVGWLLLSWVAGCWCGLPVGGFC